MNSKGLEACPFCGSFKLKVESKTKNEFCIELHRTIQNRTYSMRCNNCHARGSTVSGRLKPFGVIIPKEFEHLFTTEDVLKAACIKKWNTRV